MSPFLFLGEFMIQTIDTKIKKINIITFVIIAILATFLVVIPAASAKKTPEILSGMVSDILDGADVAKIVTGDEESPYSAFYTFMIGTDDDSEFIESYGSVITVFKVLGFLWCMAITAAQLFTLIDKGQDPFEGVMKTLAYMAIAGIFVLKLDDIMAWIIELGTFIIEQVAPSETSTAGIDWSTFDTTVNGKTLTREQWFLNVILNQYEGSTFIFTAKGIAVLLIPWLLSKAIGVAGAFIGLQTLIDIGLRRLLAPLAVADVYQEGFKGPGIRYLKKFYASFLTIAIILIISNISATLITVMAESIDTTGVTGFSKGFSFVFSILTVNFTAIGSMFKANSWANDVTGG